jgi:hypothetical protein
MTTLTTTIENILDGVRADALQADVFSEVKINARGILQCAARGAAEPAWYRLQHEGGAWQVSLVTSDRWLSESIEADLMHFGDPIEELIEEELVEQGYTGPPPTVKHYRSPDMLYTFLSPIPVTETDARAIRRACTQFLLAYEAAFRELGDMSAGEGESDD